MSLHDLSLVNLLHWILPPVSVVLWLSAYLIYFGRQPEVRDWVARHILRRRAAPAPARGNPILFRTPMTRVPGPAAPALITSPTTTTSSTPPSWSEWCVDHLPLRYRLLGQVRGAENDT